MQRIQIWRAKISYVVQATHIGNPRPIIHDIRTCVVYDNPSIGHGVAEFRRLEGRESE